jgi:chemotaxis protein methyltransferase CheR
MVSPEARAPRQPANPVHPGDRPADAVDVPGVFFREPYHYELLARTVLPELARARRRLQLWSAGASGGEAWSMAMVVQEARLSSLETAIVATDHEPRRLAHASEAVYPDHDMRGVNAERRRRHFVRGQGSRSGLWRVIAELRDQVEFVELDLLGAWPERGAFDVVFCTGPITELPRHDAERLARRFAEVLAPGGAMFLAAPARLDGIPGVVAQGRGVYRKP